MMEFQIEWLALQSLKIKIAAIFQLLDTRLFGVEIISNITSKLSLKLAKQLILSRKPKYNNFDFRISKNFI